MKHLYFVFAWLGIAITAFSQGSPRTFDTISQLTNQPPGALATGSATNAYKISAYVRGYRRPGDGGGGWVYWTNSSATVDNGYSLPSAGGYGRWLRDLQGGPITPMMYGANADAVTPDDTYFNLAKAFATSNNIALRVTAGQYMISNVVIWNTNCNVIFDDGAELIRPAGASNYTFRIERSTTPTYQQVLQFDVREGNTSIYLTDTNGFASGQWIIIRDQSSRDPNGTQSDNPNMEINQILRIETNRIDLLSHAKGDYRLSNTNEIAIIGELNVNIVGFKATLITNNTTAGGIFMNYVTGGSIENAHIEGNYLPGIHFQRSSRVRVMNTTVRRGTGIEIGGIGYGLYASRSSHDITFENCLTEGIRENQCDSGARNISWIGCRAMGHYDDGFNTHGAGTKHIKFIGCTVNECRGYGILAGFEGAHWEDTYVDIIDCNVRANLSAIYTAYSNGTNNQVRILGNTLQGQRWAIEVGSGGRGLEIANNRCTPFGESLTGGGIWITNTVGAHIHDNKLQGYISSGFILGVGCSNNIVRNTELIDLLNTSAMIVAGGANVLDGVSLIRCTSAGVTDTGSRNRWSRFDAADMASGQALMFNGAIDPVLDGFSFRNVANAILLTNLTKATIRNGTIVASTNSTNPVKLYASNVGFENVTWDGTYATNANDTAVYQVTGTNNTYTACRWSPASLFDNCIYSEVGVERTTVLDSFFQDGCVARMIGGTTLGAMTLRGNTFRNSPAYPIRPNGGTNWTIIGNTFENTPVWAISAVSGVTNAYIAFNTFRGYSTTNATSFPNRSLVIETMNHYGSTPETFWSIPAITNGLPSSIPTNNVFVYSIIGSTGPEIWGLRYNGSSYVTNQIYPTAGSSLYVDSTLVTSPNFGDTVYVDIDSVGTNVTADFAVGAFITNVLVAGSNITIDKSSGTNVVISSSGGGGATNGTPVYVDAAGPLSSANFGDSSEINPAASGTNITFSLVSSSIATNKINTTFWNWINGKTSITNLDDLSDVAITSPSAGQLLMYTNSIWTNITVSFGGGTTYTGTNGVTVSGSVISGYYYPSNNITFTTNANGSISISAVVSTNSGTTVYVDAAGPQSIVNFADGGGIGFTLTGTNVTADVEANAVALATDTTGNYVATIAGTANQISVSGSGSENAAVTLSLPSTVAIDTLNVGTLNLTNRMTTNVLTLSTSPVIIGRTLGGSGVAQELTITGAGAVTIITNAGGIIVSNPVVTGGGGGTTFVAGTPVTNANFVSSANATVSTSSTTNVTYTFTGVGSATNGYLWKSGTSISISNTTSETEVFSWSIPAGTLSEDGDELEFYIPGRYLTYSGQTTGYNWSFAIDYNTGTEAQVLGEYSSAFANTVTTFAIEWKARVKRVSTNTASLIVEHVLGADISTDLTNAVYTTRYIQDHTLDSGATWSANSIPFGLTFTPGSANTGHGIVAFGSTIVKIGSAGGNGTSISDTSYGAGWNGDTTVAPSKNAVYDEMELRAPKAGPTFSGTATNTGSFGAPTMYVGSTNIASAIANKQDLDSDLTALAGGTVMSTLITNAASIGVKADLIAGTTNVVVALAAKAPLASPALTGDPTVPTAAANDNDTSAASTAYVQSELTAYASDTVTFTGKTLDAAGTGNVIKMIRSIKLSFPRAVDNAGCTYPNSTDPSLMTFMQPQFSGTAATNANWCRWAIRVPDDIDTGVDLTAKLTIELGGADTGAHTYHVGQVSIANSAAAAGTLGNWAAVSITGDASGASGDIESSSSTTLTSWRSNLTAGQWWLIELRRDGANDASTVASLVKELEIFYTCSQ